MTLYLDFARYQGLIFDLDGTLIDSMPYHVRAWQQVCREHQFDITPEFIYERGGMSSRNIVKELAAAGCNVGSIDDFTARKIQLYREHINEVPLIEPVFKILTTARARGAKITIGTGTQRINVEDMVRIHHLEPLVDFIVSSDDVTRHKPEPETYLKALELMQLAPEQCLVIEDGLPGIKAAASAHIDCLEVLNGEFVKFHPGR